jgi:glutamate formiminotransferase
MSRPLFEIVPNVSEGRDARVVDACIAAVESAGARVIHRTSDPAHHRSVITAVGSPEEVLGGSVALAGVAAKHIDLRVHRGEHPRIGALDVLPFVPLRGASLPDAARLARDAGAKIWEMHGIPSYFYGAAASVEHRRLLADVRRGEFEGLAARMRDPDWRPDVGDRPHPRAGAVAIGARDVLIAFNVDLDTGDLELARSIASRLRERSGGLQTLRALGLRREPDVVQVSFNITDFEATPIYRVVELVRALAGERGVRIKRSELIGLVPRRALMETAAYYAGEPWST